MNQNFFVDKFFSVNNFTEENLRIIEHILNKSFPKYHINNNTQ